MSFEVGTHVDLSYLNQSKVLPAAQKKSTSEAARRLYDVGTQFIFWITPAGFKAAIKIPVAFA